MAKEIERKFIVTDTSYEGLSVSHEYISQAYLSVAPEATVRVRIYGTRAFITVKGINKGAVRNEWEYEIPMADAEQMMRICGSGLIEKVRYIVPYEGHNWEVDRFCGHLQGLVLAEIELASEHDSFALPPFIGEEVTGDARYYNSNLSKVI